MTNTPKTYPNSFTVTSTNFLDALKILQSLVGSEIVIDGDSAIKWSLFCYADGGCEWGEECYGTSLIEALQKALSQELTRYHKAEEARVKASNKSKLAAKTLKAKTKAEYDDLLKPFDSGKMKVGQAVASLRAMDRFLTTHPSYKKSFANFLLSYSAQNQINEIWNAITGKEDDE